VPRALPILSSLISSFEFNLAKSASYEASHYAVFSSFLPFHPLWAQYSP
jgi:hypothetical protein